MNYKYLQFLADRVNKTSVRLKPSDENTILEIEKILNIKFPEVIREFFLIIGGNRYDLFWYGLHYSNHTLKTLPSMIDDLKMELKLLDDFDIESSFYNLQLPILNESEIYDFVMLNEGENPPVYRFSFELFSEWNNLSKQDLDNWLLRSFNGLPPSKYRGALKLSDSFSEYVKYRLEIYQNLAYYD